MNKTKSQLRDGAVFGQHLKRSEVFVRQKKKKWRRALFFFKGTYTKKPPVFYKYKTPPPTVEEVEWISCSSECVNEWLARMQDSQPWTKQVNKGWILHRRCNGNRWQVSLGSYWVSYVGKGVEIQESNQQKTTKAIQYFRHGTPLVREKERQILHFNESEHRT